MHTFVNNLARTAGTYLYGRRMPETMSIWQTVGIEPTDTSPAETAPPTEELDFAEMSRAADKVVYSRTLDTVWTPGHIGS